MAKRTGLMELPDNGEGEYYIVPQIAVDSLIHTDEHPECLDPDCGCHSARIDELSSAYQDGLVSAEDATRIAQGKTV